MKIIKFLLKCIPYVLVICGFIELNNNKIELSLLFFIYAIVFDTNNKINNI